LCKIFEEVFGEKEKTKKLLKEHGLKCTAPEIMIEGIVEDICLQSVLGKLFWVFQKLII